jgi:hypothetical protein
MSTAPSAAFFVLLCACSDGAAPRDAITPDIDNGSCGSMVRFTGEYVDWDSSSAAFCGIFGAQFQVEGGGANGATAPNGRFDLCIPDAPMTLVDITPPVAQSQCTVPHASYVFPAVAVATKAEILAGGAWSGRGFVMGRQTPDPAKAQVLVHVNGAAREVVLSALHGPTQARMNDTWAAGASGQEVFFLDVDPAGGNTTLTAVEAIGTGVIPLVAGKMTIVSIITK